MLRLLAALVALPLSGCVKMTIAWADLSPDGPAARPPAPAPG